MKICAKIVHALAVLFVWHLFLGFLSHQIQELYRIKRGLVGEFQRLVSVYNLVFQLCKRPRLEDERFVHVSVLCVYVF